MEYGTYTSKDAFQKSSGDNRTIRSQDESRHLVARSSAGRGFLEQGPSGSADAVVPRDLEASFLNLDASYKNKLRTGVIDFLNTVNDSKYRGNTFAKLSIGYSGYGPLARSCEIPVLSSDASVNSSDRLFQSRSYRRLNERKKLYRSNSSLELDHFNKDGRHHEAVVLGKDYGSANSLDVVQSSSFQSYTQDLENLNRLAKTEPLPRGGGAMIGHFAAASTSKTVKMQHHHPAYLGATGSTAVYPLPTSGGSGVAITADSSSHSPRPEIKFHKAKENKARNEGGGIFRKLRGVKSDPSGATSLKSLSDSNAKSDAGSKAFCHYDCQSIGVKMSDVIRRRIESNNDVSFKRLNVTTGASAASVTTRVAPSSSTTDLDSLAANDDADIGDGKSNEMLLSCSFFHNELGGERVRNIVINREAAKRRSLAMSGIMTADSADLITDPSCNAVQVLDRSSNGKGVLAPPIQSVGGHAFEYFDDGAYYYRRFFSEYDHQNFFGIDDNIGPVAISIRREKVFEKEARSSDDKTDSSCGWFYQYRIIVRTSELTSLRGIVLEDNIPSSSRLSSAKGLLAKDILEFIVPSLNVSCLHQAVSSPKMSELLMKVDEQGISKAYKIGIMVCRAGQATEEEMYNNEFSSPAFDEFLNLIGARIKLKGFENYRGGLDIKSDSTGTESFYTKLDDYEIMFHISTLLPFTPNNKQQLLRKRHIGNDIVTIIFQEPGAEPFTPKSVRSQFQHVFIIVRAHNPNSENTRYSVSVSRSKNVPYFGPIIPESVLFPRSKYFREFLLVKAINAENAVHKSDKFMAMAVRTRQEYLKDLALNHVISSSIDSGSRLSKLTLGSGRKKDKARLVRIPDIRSKAAVVWNVHVEDFENIVWISCHLGVGLETLVIIEESTSTVLFTVPCRAVIGWTLKLESNSLRIFINEGECIFITTNGNDLKEIVSRLEIVTTGCHTEEKTLSRNSDGHLGFHVYNGIVCEIDSTPALSTKLKLGSNIVEVCSVFAATLTRDQLIDALRTPRIVSVSVIPPYDNGDPRSVKPETSSGLNVEQLLQQHSGKQSWLQHQHHLSNSSNHSSLERKGLEQLSKVSMNDLRSDSLEDIVTLKAGEGNSGEFQVTFHPSYSAQNAYKGSHLSLAHKSEPIGSVDSHRNIRSVGTSISVPFGQTVAATTEELKQATVNRNSVNVVDHLRQSPNLRARGGTGDRFLSSDSVPAKTYVPNFRLNNDFDPAQQQQQQHLSHSHSFNKGDFFSPGSDHVHLTRVHHLSAGLEVPLDMSDALTNDSIMKYRKSANARTPTSSRLTPSKSFQKDLIRLIDTEVPPSEIWVSSAQGSDDYSAKSNFTHLHHSDDNICASTQRGYSSLDDSHSELFQQKTKSSNVVEIPGTIFRLQTSHSSTAIPLPVVSNARDDWSSLLDAATRTFGDNQNGRSGPVETIGHNDINTPLASSTGKGSSVYRTPHVGNASNNHAPLQSTRRGRSQDNATADVNQSTDEAQSDAARVKELEARVASLDRELQMERKDKLLLQLEMDNLHQDNVRLQEESQTAAAQLRKFTEWFFQTIDKR